MNKFDEYCENVEKCQRMAHASRESGERVMWFQMAQLWLRKIPQLSFGIERVRCPEDMSNRQASFGAEH